MPNRQTHRISKRIIALSDGTWKTAGSKTPSNIVRIARGIKKIGDDGWPQLVMYDAGVGTSGFPDRFLGGLFGVGIDENIVQLYIFIATNYEPGDEIYLFGFSRGAYTVRSLAGMIRCAGLLRFDNLQRVWEAYELYRTYGGRVDENPTTQFRRAFARRVPIALLACFDTVGALGIPMELFGMATPHVFRKRYQFHNTSPSVDVLNAIHIVSIDEDRAAYASTPMIANPTVGEHQVTSVFFWGTHSGVGGSKAQEAAAGASTLRFVIEEMRARRLKLDFFILSIPPFYSIGPLVTPRNDSALSRTARSVGGLQTRVIESIRELHWSAVHRYQAVPTWRPPALSHLEETILSTDVSKFFGSASRSN